MKLVMRIFIRIRIGDELTVYLVNGTGPVSLVMDLRIR